MYDGRGRRNFHHRVRRGHRGGQSVVARLHKKADRMPALDRRIIISADPVAKEGKNGYRWGLTPGQAGAQQCCAPTRTSVTSLAILGLARLGVPVMGLYKQRGVLDDAV